MSEEPFLWRKTANLGLFWFRRLNKQRRRSLKKTRPELGSGRHTRDTDWNKELTNRDPL